MSDIKYELYTSDRIAIRGDKEKYKDILKTVNARWNPRMRGGEGWLIPVFKQKELEKLIATLIKKEESEYLDHSDDDLEPSSDDDLDQSDGDDSDNELERSSEDLDQSDSSDDELEQSDNDGSNDPKQSDDELEQSDNDGSEDLEQSDNDGSEDLEQSDDELEQSDNDGSEDLEQSDNDDLEHGSDDDLERSDDGSDDDLEQSDDELEQSDNDGSEDLEQSDNDDLEHGSDDDLERSDDGSDDLARSSDDDDLEHSDDGSDDQHSDWKRSADDDTKSQLINVYNDDDIELYSQKLHSIFSSSPNMNFDKISERINLRKQILESQQNKNHCKQLKNQHILHERRKNRKISPMTSHTDLSQSHHRKQHKLTHSNDSDQKRKHKSKYSDDSVQKHKRDSKYDDSDRKNKHKSKHSDDSDNQHKYKPSKNSYSSERGKKIKNVKKYKQKYKELGMYKIFSKNPNKFSELFQDNAEEEYSSSSNNDESSDGLPTPETPMIGKYNRNVANEDLVKQMRDLQRKLIATEIQNRKLKSKQRI